MGMRNLAAVGPLLLLVALLFSGCLGPDTPPTPVSGTPTAAPDAPTPTAGKRAELHVGFVFSPGAAGTLSDTQAAAARLAIAEINAAGRGPLIVPTFVQSSGAPDATMGHFRDLIGSVGVHAIVGPTTGAEARAVAPIAQESKVPMLAVSVTGAGVTDVGDYIFRDSLSEFQLIPAAVEAVKEHLKPKKVALLYARDDPFSVAGAELFRAELKKVGIEIAAEQTFSTSATDLSTELHAVAEAEPDAPDALAVSALAAPSALLVKQARDIPALSDVPIIGGSGFSSPAFLKEAGAAAAQGAMVAVPWSLAGETEASKQFVVAYKKAYGREPDLLAAQAYAGVYILHDAATRANLEGKSLADARTALRDALKGTGDLPTVLGPFSFTDRRDASHPPMVLVAQGGEWAVLK